jgi:hypothetical protein
MISMAGDGKLFTTIASGIKRWREQLLRHWQGAVMATIRVASRGV